MRYTLALVAVLFTSTSNNSCSQSDDQTSLSGLQSVPITVPRGVDGLAAEQRNVRDRLLEDNKPGAIKHLYVISAFSGDVLLYSTVRGKVTSSGKRLHPFSVSGNTTKDVCSNGFGVNFPSGHYCTSEVLQDDGTYGSSVDYLYWWDTKGVYHQHYVAGGQIIHVSAQPLRVGKVRINLSPAEDGPQAGR